MDYKPIRELRGSAEVHSRDASKLLYNSKAWKPSQI